ncbi:MAG: hypothetical protein ABSH46_03680 [Bryobacteraceae bacterium]|jgi:hypothetical protein
MKRLLFTLSLTAVCASAQYKLESAGAPPSEVAPAIRDALQKDGAKIAGPNGTVCEVWLRTQVPAAANSEQNVSFTDIAQGTLVGVVRFPVKGTDRRGQSIQPGVYTLRLSFYPADGAHQGVAQTRDFLLMSPAATDTDSNATPAFDQLVAMSKKASGVPHPAVLNCWKPDSPGPAALKQEGADWVLYGAIGDRPIALIVVGTYQS